MKHKFLLAFFALVSSSFLVGSGCGGDEKPAPVVNNNPEPTQKLGDPCNDTQKCVSPLVCKNNVCQNQEETQTTELPKVDVAYFQEDNNNFSLNLVTLEDNKNSDVKTVNSTLCTNGCQLSSNKKTFLYYDNDQAKLVPYKGQPITEGCNNNTCNVGEAGFAHKFNGRFLLYRKNDDAFYVVDTTQSLKERKIFESSTPTNGLQWTLSDDNSTAVGIQIVGTSIFTLYTIKLDNPKVYTPPNDDLLKGGNSAYEEAGQLTLNTSDFSKQVAYLQASDPVGISPDGNYIAFATNNMPIQMDPKNCSSDNDCSAYVGAKCIPLTTSNSSNKKCYAQRTVLHIYHTNEEKKIGEPCSAIGDGCGQNECNIVHEGRDDENTCIPRRIILGAPNDSNTNFCQLTNNDDELFFTKVTGSLSFDKKNNLYFAAARDCTNSSNTSPSSAILKLEHNGKKMADNVSVVLNHKKDPYQASKCKSGETITSATCKPYLYDVKVDPKGERIVFLGTNPHISSLTQWDSNLGLWTIGTNGNELNFVNIIDGSQYIQSFHLLSH